MINAKGSVVKAAGPLVLSEGGCRYGDTSETTLVGMAIAPANCLVGGAAAGSQLASRNEHRRMDGCFLRRNE